ncbi:MAG: peptidase domain-containing ABC transporter [Muribaculaceae bacterium]
MTFNFKKNKIHVYQQLEHSDCGQTCVRILCRYYGLKMSSSFLRSIIEGSRQGMSIGEIRSTLEKLGFETVAVKVPIEKVRDAPLPCILYWNQNHFVVLYKINVAKGRYYIVDPSEGKRCIRQDDFQKSFCQDSDRGIMLLADPGKQFTADIPAADSEPSGLIRMVRHWLRRHRKSFMWIILLMMIGMAADVAIPFLFQNTIDEGIIGKDIHLIWLLIVSQLLIFIGGYLTSGIVEFVLTRLGLTMGIEMLNEYLHRLVRMPMDFFARKVNSDFLQKIEDHNRLRAFFTGLPQSLIFTIINLLLFGGLLIWFSPLVFTVFIVFTFLGLIWVSMFLRYRREIDYSLATHSADNRNNLFELVRGVDEVKANNAHLVRVDVWTKVQQRINRLSMKSAMMTLYQNGGHTLLVRIRDISITGICATLVVQEQMTLGVMMTVSYIAGRLAGPFGTIITSVNNVQDACMSYNRIEEIHSASMAKDEGRSIKSLESIVLDNVSFRYPGYGSPYVVKDVSINIEIGKVTAFVGESGSGKSTLLKLLLGFFNVSQGTLCVNGTVMQQVKESSFLEKAAIVMQNGTLFSASIMQNIAIADTEPDPEKVAEAARIAGISEFIESLPMGYHTRIGKTGVELSGGQRQRIFIARAVYREPELLMLDEATSSLDAITEAEVMENIFRHFEGRTVIVAAHRLSTVRCADRILVMQKGRIVESGSHDELMSNDGYYRHLVKRQLVTIV